MRRNQTDFKNTYEDDAYAEAYAKLEFPGTYYLAFRDLPELISRHVTEEGRRGGRGGGLRALDIGCGTGRSTRFLRSLGFYAVGVDISQEMVRRAHEIDPEGDYRLVEDADLSQFADESFDLVLSAFTFDNIPTQERKVALFREMARVLKSSGRIINLVSTPEIYLHEWASFSTKDFSENARAMPGDEVRIIVTAIGDPRPAVDILWPDKEYRETYEASGLHVLDKHNPLGRSDEPYNWVNETKIAPWSIYVLARM